MDFHISEDLVHYILHCHRRLDIKDVLRLVAKLIFFSFGKIYLYLICNLENYYARNLLAVINNWINNPVSSAFSQSFCCCSLSAEVSRCATR